MKRYLAILACVAFFYGTAFAQLSGPQDLSNIDSGPQVRIAGPKTTLPASTDQKANASIPDARASLAMTSAEYPVTPGASYSLSFINSTGIVTLPIIVDLETQVNLSNLGKIEAHGMLFATLRKIVEKKVLDAYQFSAPRLIILSCGLFPVPSTLSSSSTTYLAIINHNTVAGMRAESRD